MNRTSTSSRGRSGHQGRKGLRTGWLLAAATLLLACNALRAAQEGGGAGTAGAGAAPAPVPFTLQVVSSNEDIGDYLERYLDISRFTGFPDLQPAELRELLSRVQANARDLLAARGYFNPHLNVEVREPAGGPGARRRIVIDVDPGEQARVAQHLIRFAEPMNSDPAGAQQRETIRREWLLQDGDAFTQAQWDAAKSQGLRVLQQLRYPAARIRDSRATVDPDTNRVRLEVTYDAGPAYRFGALRLEGVKRYDAQGVRNIAHLPTGNVYSEAALLDSQQRLIASGYFDSAFLMLDSSHPDPRQATVVAQLHEAPLQKIVFGAGYSTDTGPRLSVDHTHNRMWPLGWRAVNRATVGTQTQSLSTNWTAMPAASGWAWNTGLVLERADAGDIKSDSLSLTGGRSLLGTRIERRYYLQYDASRAEGSGGPPGSSSLLGNYAWTDRDFDDRLAPTSGHGLAFEAGAGMTVTPRSKPFLRLVVRALQLWPFGERNEAGKRSRLALRAEFGTIFARQDADIPSRLLFLTGGDTTVRGYSYQSIGARLPDGSIYGARNMALGSVEWQHPITLFGNARSFEHVLFVDAGTAADKLRHARLFPGVGTGLRWASAVGPLELDVAYGTKTGKWRLHLRVGFQFQ